MPKYCVYRVKCLPFDTKVHEDPGLKIHHRVIGELRASIGLLASALDPEGDPISNIAWNRDEMVRHLCQFTSIRPGILLKVSTWREDDMLQPAAYVFHDGLCTQPKVDVKWEPVEIGKRPEGDFRFTAERRSHTMQGIPYYVIIVNRSPSKVVVGRTMTVEEIELISAWGKAIDGPIGHEHLEHWLRGKLGSVKPEVAEAYTATQSTVAAQNTAATTDTIATANTAVSANTSVSTTPPPPSPL